MNVIKRDGRCVSVQFDKVTYRITRLCYGLNLDYVNPVKISQQVIQEIYDGITTSKLDELASQICFQSITKHPDFGILAARISISNLHKNTKKHFSDVIDMLYHNKDVHSQHSPLISKKVYNIVCKNKDTLNSVIVYDRDFSYSYFGFKTLERSYLMKINKIIVERPQHMLMRVAIGIHMDDIQSAIETYHLLSERFFIHATPTLFNAGTPKPQKSSCYLLGTNDSIEGIFKTVTDSAMISKWAGGIGIHISNIRASGSIIRGTNGVSNGIIPMIKLYNDTAKYINQGGKRLGSIAIYIEPWHPEILEFLDAKKGHGNEEERARDIFYGLWIPDLFMERVDKDEMWSLMCPDECPGLSDVYGKKFNELYLKYEKDGKYRKQIKARKIWNSIISAQIETGTPYMCYKDHVNRKSNQKNIGTIKSSNLCTEIMEYSDNTEYAVCNLASIGLPMYIKYPDVTNIKFKIYSMKGCIFCDYSKRYLKSNNINYEVINLTNKTKRDEFFMNLNEKLQEEYELNVDNNDDEYEIITTMPQIYVNDNINDTTDNWRRLGGFKEMMNYFRPTFNFEKLHKVTQVITKNLNKIIDVNYYPVPETKKSNKKHRPIGIGVQGLADVFIQMRYPFDSLEAKQLNKDIFETIYHASLTASCNLAKEREDNIQRYKELLNISSGTYHGHICFDNTEDEEEFHILENKLELTPTSRELTMKQYSGAYSTFIGSPVSQGILQYDMWNVTPSDRWDWKELKNNINTYGIRNSLLVAPMPTASTSQILNNNECIEPYTSNLYLRKTLAGEFTILNKHMVKDLLALELWNDDIKDKIVYYNGSIQQIDEIPDYIKKLYKTVWEIKQRVIIDMAVDRGAYVCQSQSLNIHMEEPNVKVLSSMHFYGWRNGLKTGSYYIRSKPATNAIKFSIDINKMKALKKKELSVVEDTGCTMCSA